MKKMRKLWFRGITTNNTWVFGSFIDDIGKQNPEPYIRIQNEVGAYYVRPETVGQFTGITDRYNKPIFEHDIVKHYIKHTNFVKIYAIEWNSSQCKFVGKFSGFDYQKPFSYADLHIGLDYEVIGNIFDNPELLETKF